ncbi:hypothetical protein C6499_04240 [Candidatus Poribacteria bacterium]|nr:MAG: hypothetical protein C6499_04240 [Candidatus Poribacteria bacterium]
MKTFASLLLILLAFFCVLGCGQENPVAPQEKPEPEKIYVDRIVEVETEKPFEPTEIRGSIYWYSTQLDGYVEEIGDVKYVKKAYVSVDHNIFGEGVEVVGVVVHFKNNPKLKIGDGVIDDGNFQRVFFTFKGEEITEGSEVRIRLDKVLRLAVYEGVLLGG